MAEKGNVIVILLGPPGSGKGTQAERLVQNQGLAHLSTGDLLRASISRNEPLGLNAKKYMDKGELVPDQIIIELASNYLKTKNRVLLDGFPRTVAQAESLDKILAAQGHCVDLVVFLEVDAGHLIDRMLKRGRTDDEPATIQNRLSVYQKQTQPLVDYYTQKNKLRRINGNLEVTTVEKNITELFAEVCA